MPEETVYQPSMFDPENLDAIASEVDPPGQPFRTAPRTVHDREIEQANEAEQLSGTRAYPSAERGIERASQAKSAVWDRLLSWALHPDERVAIALLKNPEQPWSRRNSTKLGIHVYARAMREANEEGRVWTPLLDALAVSGLWPGSIQWQRAEEEDWLPHHDGSLPDWEGPFPRMRGVVPWRDEQTDPRALEPLLHYDFEFAGVIAAEAAIVDDRLIERIIENEPQHAESLIQNPAVTQEQIHDIIRWAVDLLEEKGGQVYKVHTERRGRRREELFGKVAMNLITLPRYKRRDSLPYPRESIDKLVELTTAHGTYGLWNWTSFYAFYSLMHLEPTIEPEDVHATVEMALQGKHAARAVAANAKASADTWYEILSDDRRTRDPKIRERLLRNPEALRDPRVRDIMRASQIKGIKAALLKTAEGREFRKRFYYMVRRNMKKAYRLLRDNHDEFVEKLKPKDLIPLLQADNMEIRTYAITTLGELDSKRAEWVEKRQAEGKPIVKRSR